MSAPLLEVLVKRPGPAFGARLRRSRRTASCTRSTSSVAQREHDAFVETLAGLGPARPRPRHRARRRPDLVYTFDPLLVTDRGAIPLRPGQAEPRAASPTPSRRGRARPGSRPSAGSRRRARSRAATRSGSARTCSASGGRCARTRRAPASSAALVGGDVRIFDVPYWRGPAELIHLMSVISPVADDLAVVYLPLLPVGLWALLGELGIRLVEVPDEEFPTLGCNVLAVRPGRRHRGRGEPADRRRAGGRRLRGPHVSRDRDRDQRLGRADLHDPADPAWLTPPAPGRRPRPAGRRPAGAGPDPERHRLRGGRRGLGGDGAPRARARRRGRVARARRRPRRPGLARRGDAADLAAGRHRAGRPGRRTTAHPVGPSRRRAAGRPGDLDRRSVGRRDPRRRVVRPGRLRHEGRRGVDPGRRPGAGGGGRPRPARRGADRRLRAVRGGRRAGHAGGHPGRRQRRSRDHHRAVEPRRRRRPCRRDHVPADRARSRRPRVAAARGRSRRSTSCSCSAGRSRPTRRAATRPRPTRS